jgi:hypothetical protein
MVPYIMKKKKKLKIFIFINLAGIKYALPDGPFSGDSGDIKVIHAAPSHMW